MPGIFWGKSTLVKYYTVIWPAGCILQSGYVPQNGVSPQSFKKKIACLPQIGRKGDRKAMKFWRPIFFCHIFGSTPHPGCQWQRKVWFGMPQTYVVVTIASWLLGVDPTYTQWTDWIPSSLNCMIFAETWKLAWGWQKIGMLVISKNNLLRLLWEELAPRNQQWISLVTYLSKTYLWTPNPWNMKVLSLAIVGYNP